MTVTIKALKAPTLVNVFKKIRQGEAIKVTVERTGMDGKTETLILNLFVDRVDVDWKGFIVYGTITPTSQVRYALTYTKDLPSQRITGQIEQA